MSVFDGIPEDYNEYESYFDGPEAKLNRAAHDEEIRHLGRVDRFLATLRPEDAQMDLFTHAEIVRWGLTHERKRPKE